MLPVSANKPNGGIAGDEYKVISFFCYQLDYTLLSEVI